MFNDLVAKVVPIGGLFSPASSFFWLYLVTAAVFALAVCAQRSRERGLRALLSAVREVFDPKVFFHRSAIVDYTYIYINGLISLAGIGLGIASAQVIAEWGAGGLTYVLGPSPALPASVLAGVAVTLASALAFDFGNFYFHWLQHRDSLPVGAAQGPPFRRGPDAADGDARASDRGRSWDRNSSRSASACQGRSSPISTVGRSRRSPSSASTG